MIQAASIHTLPDPGAPLSQMISLGAAKSCMTQHMSSACQQNEHGSSRLLLLRAASRPQFELLVADFLACRCLHVAAEPNC